MKHNAVIQWLLDRGLPVAAAIIFGFGFVMWAIAMGFLWWFLKKFH